MALVVVAILLESGRPILFCQLRLGRNGQPFRIYKFRKFYPTCGSDGAGVTVKGDSRMTPLGYWLERTKLDELPQLWNIFVGEMSFVGPRPESIKFADCFDDRYREVLAHTPGIFGPNQVFFRSERELYPADEDPEAFYRQVLFPMKADIDLAYFSSRSLLQDVGWIVRGVLAVLNPRLVQGLAATPGTIARSNGDGMSLKIEKWDRA